MPDAPDRNKRTGKVWYALTILLFIAIAVWEFYVPRRPTREPIGSVISRIDQGDTLTKVLAIRGLYGDLREWGEFAQVFPHLIQAMKDESEAVRIAAAAVVGDLFPRLGRKAQGSDKPEATIGALCPPAQEALTALLDDASPTMRARAAESLGSIALIGKLDAPPPRLVACLDDEAEQVRADAAEALIEYGKGPELVVPVALRRLPNESPAARKAFTAVFWFVRLEPSVLPLLIEGLASENAEVCLSCTAAINHMGRDAKPALPAILTLIRKELEMPHPPDASTGQEIIGMAAGAVGELTPDAEPPAGAVELLCEVVKRASGAGQGSAPDRPSSPVPSAKAQESQKEFRLAEAVWSLGILGRSAQSAVPLLLSTYESAPEASDHLRGLIAESLAEIGRGTPEADRVLATLAKALRTAPQKQKAVIARALRRLGPKSEQLVPELRQFPPDGTRSLIRPVRYPRSRHEMPVRE